MTTTLDYISCINEPLDSLYKEARKIKKNFTRLVLAEFQLKGICDELFFDGDCWGMSINDWEKRKCDIPKIKRIEFSHYQSIKGYEGSINSNYLHLIYDDCAGMIGFSYHYHLCVFHIYFEIKELSLFLLEYKQLIKDYGYIVSKICKTLYADLKEKGINKKVRKYDFEVNPYFIEDYEQKTGACYLTDCYLKYFETISKYLKK